MGAGPRDTTQGDAKALAYSPRRWWPNPRPFGLLYSARDPTGAPCNGVAGPRLPACADAVKSGLIASFDVTGRRRSGLLRSARSIHVAPGRRRHARRRDPGAWIEARIRTLAASSGGLRTYSGTSTSQLRAISRKAGPGERTMRLPSTLAWMKGPQSAPARDPAPSRVRLAEITAGVRGRPHEVVANAAPPEGAGHERARCAAQPDHEWNPPRLLRPSGSIALRPRRRLLPRLHR